MTEIIPFMQPKRVITRSFQNTEYTVRIARPITEIDDFEEELMVFEEANEGDFVRLQLSSPGGSLETCDFICRRMDECRAPIVAEIGMTCASAASAICLHADDWIIHESSTMMIHACSYSPGYGKEVDVRASVDNTSRINKEWVERTYRGFLTEDELEKVLDGKDLYFYADDLRERLPLYQAYREQVREDGCECGTCDSEQGQVQTLDEMIADAVECTLHKVLDAREKKTAVKKTVKKTSEAPKQNVEENLKEG